MGRSGQPENRWARREFAYKSSLLTALARLPDELAARDYGRSKRLLIRCLAQCLAQCEVLLAGPPTLTVMRVEIAPNASRRPRPTPGWEKSKACSRP